MLTVDSTLELLATDLTFKIAYPDLLIQFDLNGPFVVAEQAHECRRKGFALTSRSIRLSRCREKGLCSKPTFFGPCGFRELFFLLPIALEDVRVTGDDKQLAALRGGAEERLKRAWFDGFRMEL
jgi:hypothetical protein